MSITRVRMKAFIRIGYRTVCDTPSTILQAVRGAKRWLRCSFRETAAHPSNTRYYSFSLAPAKDGRGSQSAALRKQSRSFHARDFWRAAALKGVSDQRPSVRQGRENDLRTGQFEKDREI